MQGTSATLSESHSLDAPVASLDRVGPRTVELLAKLEIKTVRDLLHHYPHRYVDLERKKPIGQVRTGEEVTVVGKVVKVEKPRVRRRGLDLTVIWLSDSTGMLAGVWFNQRYLGSRVKPGDVLALSGRVGLRYGRFQMESPLYEVLSSGDGPSLHTGRIVPVHPTTAGLTTRQLRLLVGMALQRMRADGSPEALPPGVRGAFPPLKQCLEAAHFPETREQLKRARARLRFEELFYLQVALALRRARTEESPGIPHSESSPRLDRLLADLPFELTVAQRRTLGEIRADQVSPRPMHRLLHGDVGSGKTLVALSALLAAIDAGHQGALMAPTEVLAEQHFSTVRRLLSRYGVRAALITGSQAPGDRKRQLRAVADGDLDLVIGTHALIQEGVAFRSLSLVVIDEQHRFGVDQRLRLREKGENPDTLIMTATPIPRTLALTFYGDLEVSVLDEMPSGRRPVKTVVIGPEDRPRAYAHIRKQVESGRQAYVICPVIDEDESKQAVSALKEASRLEEEIFPDLKVGLLHGRMRPSEKQAVMSSFVSGDIAVLISTTVVEVGVDVPNATVIMVESADRFGLSQLHQLRGRVGRGDQPSWCILVSQVTEEDGVSRMEAIAGTTDGFRLAEIDLELRGEGQIFGVRQSGMPDLKLAALPRDLPVLEQARKAAFDLVAADPHLALPEHEPLKAEVVRRYEETIHWLSRS